MMIERQKIFTINNLQNLLSEYPNQPHQTDNWFLEHLLNIVYQSNDNQDIIYDFLKKNCQHLNLCLVTALYKWWQNILLLLESRQELKSIDFDYLFFTLGGLLQKFPLNQPVCLEIAIAAYNCALTVKIQNKKSQNWALIQQGIGCAYINRIKGSIANNIEQAIEHYQNALVFYTKENFPCEWAININNLASAYQSRIKGDRSENIEKARLYCQKTLNIFTYKEFPYEWSGIQHNLGVIYYYRIKDDRAENVEQAIIHFQNALTVRTKKDFRVDWAMTENDLAIAYSERIKGDRAENVEQAIEHYENALTVYTQKDFPVQWASTENNLANAYRERIKGDRAENVEQAIKHYENALTVRTPETLPLECLDTRKNLANLYYDQKNWQLASESYAIGIEIIEKLRTLSLDDTRRQEIIEDNLYLYKRIVECYRHLQKPELVITYLERGET